MVDALPGKVYSLKCVFNFSEKIRTKIRKK